MQTHDEELENLMKDVMKKEMLKKIEDKITNGDRDIIKAIKYMMEDEEHPGDNF